MNLNEKMLYKLLRYILQATMIYLLLRYIPYIRLTVNNAAVVTIILILIFITLELAYNFISSKMKASDSSEDELLEKFNNACDNNSCGRPINQTENKPICRVVCERPNKIEGFNGEEHGAQEAQEAQEKQEEKKIIKPKPEIRVEEKQMEKRKIEMMEEKVEEIPAEEQKPVNDEKYYWGNRYGNVGYDTRYGFGGMYHDEYPFYNRFISNDYSTPRNIGADKGDLDYDRAREKREKLYVESREKAFDERARSTRNTDPFYQEPGEKSQKRKSNGLGRRIEGTIDDELPYTDYNHLPVAAGYKSHDYEYGYSFIPPERWAPISVRPPICVTEKRNIVAPVLANGSPMDVKEFYSDNRITPPDLINVDYINDKLNAGR